MQLSAALDCVATEPQPELFEQFEKDLPMEWIEESLNATGTATVRRRRMPAEQVVWLVIGMALMRDRPIAEVVNKLDLALPSKKSATVAPSAIVQSRDRLGETAMAHLFATTSDVWAHKSADADRWRGLALYAVDGTTFRVPDSEENRAHFGLASAGSRGESGYPLVRMSALMAARSHLLAAASFGPYKNGEHSYALDLWPCLPNDSLVLVDRGFLSAALLLSVQNDGTNRHWLLPAKSTTKWRIVKHLGTNDDLVEMDVSSEAHRKHPSLPRTWIARAICYQRKGFRPRTLLTSLVDSDLYPANEIVELYHERWEIELGYGEVKTEMLESVPLRSKNSDRIRQEIWGILIAYNLIRLEMERAAGEAKVSPTRISFVMVYRMIRDEWLWCAIASPGAIPRHLKNLRAEIKLFILPERRSERSYPRAVKVKMSNYAKKHRASDPTKITTSNRSK